MLRGFIQSSEGPGTKSSGTQILNEQEWVRKSPQRPGTSEGGLGPRSKEKGKEKRKYSLTHLKVWAGIPRWG